MPDNWSGEILEIRRFFIWRSVADPNKNNPDIGRTDIFLRLIRITTCQKNTIMSY